MKRSDFFYELFFVMAILAILACLLAPPIYRAKVQHDKQVAAEQEALAHPEFVVVGEGYYDHAEYPGPEETVVYFSDGRTVPLHALVAMPYPKGSKIRISLQKSDASYKIELLEAEVK